MIWAIGGVSLLGLLAVALVVSRPRSISRRTPPPSPPRASSRESLHAELVSVRDVPRERRTCGRCRYQIRHEREGDLCWIAVRRSSASGRTGLVHYHRECADETGEPLP